MKQIVEVVAKSQRFTPTDERGGTLTWKERVIRPGFRPTIRERSIRKDYHLSTLPEPEATVLGDAQVR